MREGIRRLHAIEPTRKHLVWERIVVDAITEVGSYSRTTDAVDCAALADRHGVATRTVGRALEWADELGVIRRWKKGNRWLVTLPQPQETTRQNERESVASDATDSPPNCRTPRSLSEKKEGGERVTDDVDDLTPDDLRRQDADQLVMTAALSLGVSLDQWRTEPARRRRRAEDIVFDLLGCHDAATILDAVSGRPPRAGVKTWAGLIRSRAEQMPGSHRDRRSA